MESDEPIPALKPTPKRAKKDTVTDAFLHQIQSTIGNPRPRPRQSKCDSHAEEARKAFHGARKERQIIPQESNQIHLLTKDTWKQLQLFGGPDEHKTMLEEGLRLHISCKLKLADLSGHLSGAEKQMES